MPSVFVYVVLFASIFAVGLAAPLAKFAHEVHPLELGFWRTGIVGLLLLCYAKVPQMSRRNWLLSIMAGVFLALHFWTWFASLQHTSTLRSTTLVCLNPLWVGLVEWGYLRQSLGRNFWVGVLVALLGVGIMSIGTTATVEGDLWWGDFLATVGGILGSLYLLIGREVRKEVSVDRYGAVVCLFASMCLGVVCLWENISLGGYTQEIWMVLVGMALVPQFVGHIGMQYTLRFISASTVSLALLLEPVGASLISYLWLQEGVGTTEILGAIVILLGVAWGMKATETNPSDATE